VLRSLITLVVFSIAAAYTVVRWAVLKVFLSHRRSLRGDLTSAGEQPVEHMKLLGALFDLLLHHGVIKVLERVARRRGLGERSFRSSTSRGHRVVIALVRDSVFECKTVTACFL